MSEAFESCDNPYAPPKTDFLTPTFQSDESCWRRGNIVVMTRGTDLPCRCIKCNATARLPIESRRIFWHPAGWYVLLLGGIFLYVLAASFIQRKAVISPGLCEEHAKRRLKRIAVAWLAVFAAIPCLMFSGQVAVLGLVGLGAGLAAIIIGCLAAVRISPIRIDDKIIELKGFGAPFLDSLPSFPGQASS